jgi:hypothetical protein
MTARRLRAPANDGGLLFDPPPTAVREQVNANIAQLGTWEYDFQGRRASRLRAHIRQDATRLARDFLASHGIEPGIPSAFGTGIVDGPLIVTGHQPELFHPGVWIKNFGAGAIANSLSGTALNLIVDNDLAKASSISVPYAESGRVRGTRVDFDRWQGEIPYEDLGIGDEERFASFADRVRTILGKRIADPVLDQFWPAAMKRTGLSTVGLRFSLARREVEASWGLQNLELPLSALCQTDGFLWFVSHLLAQLPRYQSVHNAALTEYRELHGIRSKNHPVAALAREGDWLEAPFWIWRAEQPRRRPLMARQRGRLIDIRIAGENEILLELPLSPDSEGCCAVERLRELPDRSIRLRTRALTTTMFSRFLLGDLFIHGIGGAKYDELGDEISRRFFNIEPPTFLTLSMTARLGVATQPANLVELRAIERNLRDLQFNPDRFLNEPLEEAARNLIMSKREAVMAAESTRRDRIERWMKIRQINASLQPYVAGLRGDLLGDLANARLAIRSNRVIGSREFAFVLHGSARLQEMYKEARRVASV